ncbi:MAG: MOSC domain-containing protein [Ignavibacteriae bacterium]|nr:MOSC domain-containing protein [Ignavibacteriota bacterium]
MSTENNNGRIAAISISKKRGIPKSNISSAILIENRGIDGDIHADGTYRQISLLSLESIEKMKKITPVKLRPGIFAENLTTESIDYVNIRIGTRIKIGNDSLLEVTQIGKECHNRCAIYESAGNCIMPDEGVFARVIKGGKIKVNDIIEVLADE